MSLLCFSVPQHCVLFEAFITIQAPKRCFDMYTKAIHDIERGKPFPPEVGEELWSKMRSKWYGWMLSSMSLLSDIGKNQMMYVTQFIKFLGLSRLGQNALQSLGLLNTLRFGDERAARSLTVQKTANRYVYVQPKVLRCIVVLICRNTFEHG